MSRFRPLAALVGVATLALAGIASPALADDNIPFTVDQTSVTVSQAGESFTLTGTGCKPREDNSTGVVTVSLLTANDVEGSPVGETQVHRGDDRWSVTTNSVDWYGEAPTTVRVFCALIHEDAHAPVVEIPLRVTGATAVPTAEPTSTVAPTPMPTSTIEPTVAPTGSSSSISADVTSVPASGEVTVTATGFAPGESVDVYLHSTPVHLTTTTADASGKVIVKVAIPAGTEPGAHHLVLTGQTSGISLRQAITVNTPTTTTTATGTATKKPATGSRLAATGITVLPLLLAGGAVLGGTALAARRRATS